MKNTNYSKKINELFKTQRKNLKVDILHINWLKDLGKILKKLESLKLSETKKKELEENLLAHLSKLPKSRKTTKENSLENKMNKIAQKTMKTWLELNENYRNSVNYTMTALHVSDTTDYLETACLLKNKEYKKAANKVAYLNTSARDYIPNQTYYQIMKLGRLV